MVAQPTAGCAAIAISLGMRTRYARARAPALAGGIRLQCQAWHLLNAGYEDQRAGRILRGVIMF